MGIEILLLAVGSSENIRRQVADVHINFNVNVGPSWRFLSSFFFIAARLISTYIQVADSNLILNFKF